jgi:hypothetical protein
MAKFLTRRALNPGGVDSNHDIHQTYSDRAERKVRARRQANLTAIHRRAAGLFDDFAGLSVPNSRSVLNTVFTVALGTITNFVQVGVRFSPYPRTFSYALSQPFLPYRCFRDHDKLGTAN